MNNAAKPCAPVTRWWCGGWTGSAVACPIWYRLWPLSNASVSASKALSEKIKTDRAAGKLVSHVSTALAEFERSLIPEPTHAGLAAACARGRSSGRKPKLGEKQVRKIKSLLRDPDIQMADVAAALWSVHTTLYKHVGEQRQHCLMDTGD